MQKWPQATRKHQKTLPKAQLKNGKLWQDGKRSKEGSLQTLDSQCWLLMQPHSFRYREPAFLATAPEKSSQICELVGGTAARLNAPMHIVGKPVATAVLRCLLKVSLPCSKLVRLCVGVCQEPSTSQGFRKTVKDRQGGWEGKSCVKVAC